MMCDEQAYWLSIGQHGKWADALHLARLHRLNPNLYKSEPHKRYRPN